MSDNARLQSHPIDCYRQRRARRGVVASAVFFLLAACTVPSIPGEGTDAQVTTTDAGTSDAGSPPDAGNEGDAGIDAGLPDAGVDAGQPPSMDGGSPDAGIPDAGSAGVDAGNPLPADSGPPESDAGVDAGQPEDDAGPLDAGEEFQDAGVMADAGQLDAGAPGCGGAGELCCADGGCTSGLDCRFDLCEPSSITDIGQPCQTAADCQSGVCLPLGNGQSVCSESCGIYPDCVPGWWCVRDQTLGASVCQCSPSSEVCDALDNDCNGLVDDGPLPLQQCVQAHGAGSVCEGYKCSCALMCGWACVNPSDDPSNCGGCGNRCAAGATCTNGQCTCPGDQTSCSGRCTDVATDPENCGTCGVTCSPGEICAGSQCQCADGGDSCIASTDAGTADLDGGSVDAGAPDAGMCGTLGQQCCPDSPCKSLASSPVLCQYNLCENPVPPPGMNSTVRGLGTYCYTDAWCASFLCMSVGGSHPVCTVSCASSADCVPGWTCGSTPQVAGANMCLCTSAPEVCDGLDNDCNGLVDDGAGPDEQCRSQYGDGYICRDGVCECPLMCDGTCVDPISDVNNCGACGVQCFAGQSCRAGQCECNSGKPCGDACVDTFSDPENCGGCGMACPTGANCWSGRCGCSDGSDLVCNDACVPNDTQNCGTCGNTCPTGASCDGSACHCPSGDSVCSGVCVNLQADAQNCGTCGNSCPAGTPYCANGGCSICPAGQILCNGVCTAILSDANNCGTCGYQCTIDAPSTVACAGGRCLATMASGYATADSITVDDSSIYWATGWDSGGVFRVPLGGGSITTLASPRGQPYGVAVNSTNAVWAENQYGYLMTAPLAGGTATTLARPFADIDGVAVDATSAYWTNYYTGWIGEVPVGGGAEVTLATGQQSPTGIVLDSSNIYWMNENSNAMNGGSLVELPKTGGTPVTLVQGLTMPSALAVDGANVYWTDNYNGNVLALSLTGGDPVTLASGQNGPGPLATDGVNIYWLNVGEMGFYSNDSVVTVPIAGGEPTTLATGQNAASAITVDGTSVYWVTNLGGTVLKLWPK